MEKESIYTLELVSFINDIKTAYNKATIAEKFIYANVAVFFAALFLKNFFINWITLKSSFSIFGTQPWTILTYGFSHTSFSHAFFNLIFLYYIGNLFLNFFSKKQFINYYILGVVTGGIAFLLLNTGGYLIGASAGIMAILVGLATKIPTYEIRLNLIGGIKIWIIALVYIIISIAGLDGLNSGGNIAHLGGALIGFIYTKQLEKGMDIGKWIENIIGFFTNLFKQKKQSPLRTVHKKANIKRKPTHKESTEKQGEINKILDKISKSGYESLNKEEKDFLFKSGNRN
ncbi:MAG: rhomboid family intramembrane serine protease [Flavobacteriaceae bacterium]|nr:rhomboid family intramembrane serine protease [Flavobacteriaceae bacterium]